MTEATTRLHITPLTPDILPSILPASLRQSATDISYHSIPTFPESSYGYLTLPTMEADKIRRKFNGSILKGKKFKVETARPPKRQREEEDGAEASVVGKKEKKKSKKHKSEEGVLDGFELPSDRKVKRGWTEPANATKDKRKSEKKDKGDKKAKPQPKPKYTGQSECLFRISVPPNRSSASDATGDKKAKKKKKSKDDSVVHEFEKTVTYPSFLRSAEGGAAPTAVFEEEKGWVDGAGNVKEAAIEKVRKDNFQPGRVAGVKEKRLNKRSAPKERIESPEASRESDDWTSSSGSSSDESSDSENETSSSSDNASELSAHEKASNAPAQSGNLTNHVHGVATSDGSESEQASPSAQNVDGSFQDVHPLEALFKRPSSKVVEDQPAQDTSTGFSFFGNGDVESDEEMQSNDPQPPYTPFTKRDLQARGLRSAAPTPDTAMINRRMNWTDADEMEEEVSLDTPVSKFRGVDGATKEETEFAKWFWEHRGENNRAWKKRRRDAAKEQRQRANRRKGLKGKS